MTLRADTSGLVPGALCASAYPGFGALGSVMKASWTTGEHGPSPLANDNLNDALEYHWYIETVSGGASVSITELGDAELTVPSDGTYTWTYRLVESGVTLTPEGSVTTTIGSGVTGTVSGAGTVNFTGLAAVLGTVSGPADIIATVFGSGTVIFSGTAAISGYSVDLVDFWPSKRKVKVAAAGDYATYQLLDFEEIDNISFDFSAEMVVGEVIVSCLSQIELKMGAGDPLEVLQGTPHLQGAEVIQKVQGVSANSAYKLRVLATLNSGRRLVGTTLLSFSMK